MFGWLILITLTLIFVLPLAKAGASMAERRGQPPLLWGALCGAFPVFFFPLLLLVSRETTGGWSTLTLRRLDPEQQFQELDAIIHECNQAQAACAFRFTGRLLQEQVLSEIHVYSRGGGGFVARGFGYFRPRVVGSSIVHRQKLWLSLDNGQESCTELPNWGIQTRAGHQMTILFLGKPHTNFGWPFAVLNHTTGQFWVNHDNALVVFGVFAREKARRYANRMLAAQTTAAPALS